MPGTPTLLPFPSFCVEEAPPFAHTGIDFAGPLHVRDDHKNKKVWTCCMVRAVPLELLPDLTTPAFVSCLKRVVARQGLPTMTLPDNGRTFTATSKEIHTILYHPEGVRDFQSLPQSPPISHHRLVAADQSQPISRQRLVARTHSRRRLVAGTLRRRLANIYEI